MGLPLHLIVANLYMEHFEIKAINTAEQQPRIWKRCDDDTFMVQNTTDRDRFLEHINSIGPCIQFKVEETRANRSMPSFTPW